MPLYSIGIDPGNSCGWAVLDNEGGLVASGTWSLTRAKGDGQGMRFVRFERLLKELLASYPDAQVGYDLIQPYGSGDAKAMYYKVVGRMEACLDELDVPYAGVRPTEYKKLATGRGNASKEQTVAAAQVRWPGLDEDMKDDEADALWMAEAIRLGLV